MADPNKSIILIGPTGSGKSTVANILNAKLNIPVIALDELKKNYRNDFALDETEETRLREQNYEELLKFLEPFSAYSVERALNENPFGIFDLGASYSVFEDQTLNDKVSSLLDPYPFVVMLIPSNDTEKNIQILLERGYDNSSGYQDMAVWERITRKFVDNTNNFKIAKKVIYTEKNTPEEVSEQILDMFKTNKN